MHNDFGVVAPLLAGVIPDSLWPMDWKRLLAYITGSVDKELLTRNEYLAEENRILRNQVKGRLRLSDAERMTLAKIGQRLGRRALEEVAQIVRPETILAWHRKLLAQKFDGSKNRSTIGRPSTLQSLEELVLQMAQNNRTWGYKRIAGALENLGHKISRETVANILKRHGLAPAPERGKRMLWKEFIQSHLAVLAAVDFFTAEVWTAGGLMTYYVLVFMRVGSRQMCVAGFTLAPDAQWMKQSAFRLRPTFSQRKKPSRERECDLLSCGDGSNRRIVRGDPHTAASGRIAEILLPRGCMNFLSLRDQRPGQPVHRKAEVVQSFRR